MIDRNGRRWRRRPRRIPTKTSETYTVAETARLFGVSVGVVYRAIIAKTIPVLPLTGVRRIPRTWVDGVLGRDQ